MPAPRPAAQATPWLLMALLLAGCSGTPLGDGLSRSFPGPGSPPQPAAAPGSPAAPPAAPAPPAAAPPPGPTRPAARPSGAARPPAAAPAPATSGLERWLSPGTPLAPGKPAPYRVTLRLPRADPAAPAEVVTRALRAAGVPFEVEMIERVQPPGSAGGAAAPALPEVRPAPPPR